MGARMASSDFLNVNLSVFYGDFASEFNKTYCHLPWALKNEPGPRMKHQFHKLSRKVFMAQVSPDLSLTQNFLRNSLTLTHKSVSLILLFLKKTLTTNLHDRWVKRLNGIEKNLGTWYPAGTKAS